MFSSIAKVVKRVSLVAKLFGSEPGRKLMSDLHDILEEAAAALHTLEADYKSFESVKE
ncbi:MAG: hypothetical protein KGL39_31515 [Patescibacteria group bacterium]|nr:hypothetical protein [Patescibacteria group bacterium]